jgi:hypothetical protein
LNAFNQWLALFNQRMESLSPFIEKMSPLVEIICIGGRLKALFVEKTQP